MQVVASSCNITHRSASDGAVDIRIRVTWIQLNRPRTIGDGALEVAQPQLRVSAGVERQGVSRIDLNRLVERLHRFGEFLLFGQVTPLPVKPIRILRRVWTRIGARRKNLWRLDRGRLYYTGPWRQLRRGDERHHHVARAGDSWRSRSWRR